MHGLGNDFVVIDARGGGGAGDAGAGARARRPQPRRRLRPARGDPRRARAWRRRSTSGTPTARAADACGNATRCVARLLMDESGAAALDLRTGRGVLRAEEAGGGLIRVNMGPPRARPGTQVPLAREMDLDAAAARRRRRARSAWATRTASSWCRTPRRSTSPAIGRAGRARPAVPGAHQRRVRAGDRPRDDPHAGLGARRR